MSAGERSLTRLLQVETAESKGARLSAQLQHICGRPEKYSFRPDFILPLFRDHVGKTRFPEHFRGLSWRRPGRHEDIELLAEFALDRKSRFEGRMIPCPVCSPDSGKFFSFYLAWSRTTGEIFIIGRICGEHHFGGGRFVDAVNRYQAERSLENDLLILREALPFIADARAAIFSLESAASEVIRRIEKWEQDGIRSLQILYSSVGDKGRMTIANTFERKEGAPRGDRGKGSRIADDGDDRDLDIRVEYFGRLNGARILDPEVRKNLKLGVKESLRHLHGFPDSFGDNDEAELWVMGQLKPTMSDASQVREMRRKLGRARDAYNALKEYLYEGARFFERENLRQIARWCQHEGHPVPLNAELGDKALYIGLRGAPESSGRTRTLEKVFLEPIDISNIPMSVEWPMSTS